MLINPCQLLRLGACILLTLSATLPDKAHAQTVSAPPTPIITANQLKTLLPDEQDLQGFVRIRPAFATPERIKPQPIPDAIRVNTPTLGTSGRTNTISSIARALYSQSDIYILTMAISFYDSGNTAHNEAMSLRQNTQAADQLLMSDPSSDDEAWFNPGPHGTSLLFRHGRVLVLVHGGITGPASGKVAPEPFPPTSVLAIGDMIKLRLAHQALLAGIPAQDTRVAVNGTNLPAQASLLVGKQVYVPVTEFAKAAGWTSQWDVTTGMLTLTSPTHKQITLAAGSTAVKAGDTAAPALKCPVLKEANQPVMVLTDLLTLTKGRITAQQGNSFKVTV